MAGLLFGPGSITEAQLVAFSAAGAVLLFLLSANVAVWRLYRRASSEDRRQAKRALKKRMSDVWVYHVNRRTSSSNIANNNTVVSASTKQLSASQQILNKLRASHENLKLTLAASAAERDQGTLGQDEHQALEELDVMADLFLHDHSNASSRRSSLGSKGSLPRHLHDDGEGQGGGSLPSGTFHAFSSSDVADDVNIRNMDKVSMSSVTMADFDNDDPDVVDGDGAKGRGGRRKKSGKRSSSRRCRGNAGDQQLPVAEFHNEAFDFAESSYTAVERVQDIEL